MAAEAFAAAKINLTLHVTGRRDDGLHLLDSLVVFADVGDSVSVAPARDWSLRVTGAMARGVPTGEDNLCLRAARLIGGAPCAITLDKRLPLASGVGGGSADAAAVLRALGALDGRTLPGSPASLGADVPVCLHGAPCRMRGIGERIDPVTLPPLFGVLVNPGVPLATRDVFAGLQVRTNAAMPEIPECWPDAASLAAFLALQRNDLEGPARALTPAIGVVQSRLGATAGCLLTRMSGSGATCFALYATRPEARIAAADLRALHPDWWIADASLGSAPT